MSQTAPRRRFLLLNIKYGAQKLLEVDLLNLRMVRTLQGILVQDFRGHITVLPGLKVRDYWRMQRPTEGRHAARVHPGRRTSRVALRGGDSTHDGDGDRPAGSGGGVAREAKESVGASVGKRVGARWSRRRRRRGERVVEGGRRDVGRARRAFRRGAELRGGNRHVALDDTSTCRASVRRNTYSRDVMVTVHGSRDGASPEVLGPRFLLRFFCWLFSLDLL